MDRHLDRPGNESQGHMSTFVCLIITLNKFVAKMKMIFPMLWFPNIKMCIRWTSPLSVY